MRATDGIYPRGDLPQGDRIARHALRRFIGEAHDLFGMEAGSHGIEMLSSHPPIRVAPGTLHQIELPFHAFCKTGAQLRLERAVVSRSGGERVIEGAGVERHAIGLASHS